VGDTASGLRADAQPYRRLLDPLVRSGFELTDGLMAPLTVPPRHPFALARYGLAGIWSAARLARRRFETDEARALFAGMAAHSLLSLHAPITAGYGLMLGLLAHLVGWPVAAGGSQRIADALVDRIISLGGQVECGRRISSLDELPTADAVLLDVSPRQLVAMTGDRLPGRYRRRLLRYRHGPGAFKIDLALDGPIPWADETCAQAGTVHLGGTFEEVVAAEDEVQRGRHPERPFVLLAQQSLFDPSRAPEGTHTVWAYCHVPNGSTVDMTERIEAQIERFAPGFRDRIIGRHVLGPADLERRHPNYIGGDINGGAADLRQFVGRPTIGLHPWRTPLDGVYLCSASTPPGGGVHGMCGLHAANEVLRAQR
jgi:phytoene dehydrogenase-like protein